MITGRITLPRLVPVVKSRILRLMTGESGQNQGHMMTVALSYTATYCNILQHTATHCNTQQSSCQGYWSHMTTATLRHIATNCNTL